jgi:2-amino-4-hydroxy-6-hydroxymethyldihydropteridine diphosphokinase
MKHVAFVGLGSNLADPASQVSNALNALDKLPQTRVMQRSSLYRSAPVGYLEQPDFINAVAQLETELAPRALLDALLALEQESGRTREFVLQPLLEIAPDCVIPGVGTAADAARQCTGQILERI